MQMEVSQMNTMSNPVEKYILEGICNGYCEYDGPENTEEVDNDND